MSSAPASSSSSASALPSPFNGWPSLQRAVSEAQHKRPSASSSARAKHHRPPPSFEVQELGPGLLTISDVFTTAQCRRMVEAAEARGMTPTNPRNLPPLKGHAFRNNDRLSVHDAAFAAELFDFLSPALHTIVRVEDGAQPCGLSPHFRFYRYRKDAWFGPHIDETQLSGDGQMESEFTMLIYLTGVDDDCPLDPKLGPLKGGATRFHHHRHAALDVEPRTGLVCLHWQLHDCLHEGTRVLGGVKWLLRTDLYFPRLSKVARMAASKPKRTGEGGVKGGKGSKRGGKSCTESLLAETSEKKSQK